MQKLLLGVAALILSDYSFALNCHGTEPFWSAQLSADKVTVSLGLGKSITEIASVSSPLGMPDSENSFVRVYSSSNGPVATTIAQQCNNGMSDDMYPYEIIIFTPNGSLYGCCGEAL